MPDAIGDRKRSLRREMRAVRRAVDDPGGRSIVLWSRVRDEPTVQGARTIMVFESIPGEPDTSPFVDWCRSVGKNVIVPDSDPTADPPERPDEIDVVIVPGVAFTSDGDRLGQGGGWYDAVLGSVRDDCVSIGVCFAEQLVDEVPTEPHDVRLDLVISA